MNDGERALCAATARWLAASGAALGALGLLSALMSALMAALALALRLPMPGLAAFALLLVPAERVWALRVRFDAGLFADLAREPAPAAAIGGLDDALAALGLRRRAATPRPLADRVNGARRLARQHAALAAVQFAAAALPCLLLLAATAPGR